MISALIKRKENQVKLGEGIWCIMGLGKYYNEGSFFIITFDLAPYQLTQDKVSEYVMDMETWGLPTVFTQEAEEYSVSFNLDYYNTYGKLVAVLTLFRVIFNKYASENIFSNYHLLTPVFPELDSLQIHQLALYKSCNEIDQLHSIVSFSRKLTTIDKFKKNFLICNKLHEMFNTDMIKNPHYLLKEPEKNKQEILKNVL